MEDGEIEAGLGLIASPAAVSGGLPAAYLGASFWPGGEIGLAATSFLLGPGGDLRAGQRLWAGERLRVDVLGGVGVAWSEADGQFYTRAAYDADGDGVQDVAVSPVTRHYSYLSFAPSAGARLSWTPSRHWVVPVSTRVAHAFIVPVSGLGEEAQREITWVDLDVAGVLRTERHLELGLGLGGLCAFEGDRVMPLPRAGLSVGFRW